MRNNKKSAGIAVIYKNKILLVHPYRGPWKGSFSIPKGGLEIGETILDGAIRELKEEVGISLNKTLFKEHDYFLTVYKSGKTVYYWIHIIQSLSEIGLQSEVVPKNQLQAEEVDWAGFVSFEDAKTKILIGQLAILDKIQERRVF